jgi:hypothetical protein
VGRTLSISAANAISRNQISSRTSSNTIVEQNL